MQLLTKQFQNQIPRLYSQENEKDPWVVYKFFDPVGSWTWYVIEGLPVDRDGEVTANPREEVDFLFFGFVVGHEPELGYFSLLELENAKQRLQGIRAVPIERDLYFKPCPLSEVKKKHGVAA